MTVQEMTAAIEAAKDSINKGYTHDNYNSFIAGVVNQLPETLQRDTETSHAYNSRMQQMRKYAILLDAIENTMTKCFISEFNVKTARVSLTQRDGYRPAQYIMDLANKITVVSDGIKLYTYTNRRTVALDDGTYLMRSEAKLSRRAAVDDEGNYLQRDARGHIHFKADYYFENDPYRTKDDTAFIKEYIVQLLMNSSDARAFIRQGLKDYTAGDYIVNHKNNDTRDLSLDNLEFTTRSLNVMHGYLVKDLVHRFPDAGYSFQINNGEKIVTRFALNFKLPIHDSSSTNNLINNVYTELLLNRYPKALG